MTQISQDCGGQGPTGSSPRHPPLVPICSETGPILLLLKNLPLLPTSLAGFLASPSFLGRAGGLEEMLYNLQCRLSQDQSRALAPTMGTGQSGGGEDRERKEAAQEGFQQPGAFFSHSIYIRGVQSSHRALGTRCIHPRHQLLVCRDPRRIRDGKRMTLLELLTSRLCCAAVTFQ